MCCIYFIKNLKNSKIYIGSTKNFKKRKNTHTRQLKNNKHHCVYLQRSYNKYGQENFIFGILEECNEKELFDKEQEWIDLLEPEYNIGSVGGGDNYTNNPDKAKIKNKLVKNLEISWKKGIQRFGKDNSNWKGGPKPCPICNGKKSFTAKTCQNCQDRTGKNNPFYNKKHSKKTIEKLRNKNKNRKPPNTQKCEINGIIYESLTDASVANGVVCATVTNRIKSKKYPNWKFVNA